MGSVIYYEFEDFRLDTVNEKLLKGNKSIPLTHKAFRTLLILVQNYGQVVKKEDIINQIWHDSFVEDSNLTQHIYVLRKTLGNNKHDKPFIETIPKHGYCFVADIQEVQSREVPVLEYTNHFTDDLDEPFIFVKDENKQLNINTNFYRSEDSQNTTVPALKKSERKFLTAPLLILVLAIGLLISSLFFYEKPQPAKGFEIKSIAVLPFKPIGDESSNAKMGFGIADAIITNLSKQQKIPVRPTSAVFQLTERNFDPIDAGRDLGVDSVLEGTVQRDNEWVRVTVRLIKISDGSTIWADKFDEKFTYIFTLQDSISTKVAKALSFNSSPEQEELLTIRNTSNTEAYQAYQLGSYFWNKRTKEDLEKAAAYFQKAVQTDQNYGLAYAMLADCYNMLHYYGLADNSKEILDKADEAAKKSLLLNDSLAEAYIAISYVQAAKYDDFNASIKSLEHAINLSPYNPTARIRYGWKLLQSGNVDGALEQMHIAQSNDPLSPISNSALCSLLLLKRNYSEALKYSEKAVELKSNIPLIKIQLASAYFLNKRTDEAVKILQEETKNPRNKTNALTDLAYIYAKTGKIKEAEDIYFQLINDKETMFSHNDAALIAYSLGKRSEAIAKFKAMLKKSKSLSLHIISSPYWSEMLKDDEFQKLILPQTS